MSAYLHFGVGRHELLLEVRHVEEIAERDGGGSAGGHRAWRGGSARVIDVTALRGESRRHEGRYQIAVRHASGEARTAVLLDADRVHRLIDIDPGAFLPLPPLSPRLIAMFDASFLDVGSGCCLFRLRYPFAWISDEDASC